MIVLAAALGLAVVPAAAADLADETALAEKFAPVVRLVEQEEECGPGEPYEPMDVDALFGDSTVALRGPWNAFDLVKIGPTAADIALPARLASRRASATNAGRFPLICTTSPAISTRARP